MSEILQPNNIHSTERKTKPTRNQTILIKRSFAMQTGGYEMLHTDDTVAAAYLHVPEDVLWLLGMRHCVAGAQNMLYVYVRRNVVF